MAVWMSWNIDTPQSLNSRDSFHRSEVENRAPTSCRPGTILSLPTISFELHAKVAEEIDLEICSYGQLSEIQMLRDLNLDLGWGQGHINIYSTYRTSSMPNRVTLASRTTEIWPFQCREIWTFGKVWTLVTAFLEGNSKIGLRQAVDQVPCYHQRPSVLSSTQKRRRRYWDRPTKVQFSQLRKLRDLDVDLRSGWGHTGAHMWSRSTHTPNYVEIGKKTLWTYGRTYARTDTPEFQSTRRRRNKKESVQH